MRPGSRRAFALAVILLVLAVVMVLGLGLGAVAAGSLESARRAQVSSQSAYTSEAGAAQGVVRLRSQSTYSGSFVHPLPGQPAETAQVTVYNNAFGTAPLAIPNGALAPPGTAYILSRSGARQTGALARVRGSLFDYGMFGGGSLFMSGTSRLDSYDSSLGSYAATASEEGGNGGTNASGAGAVTLEQNARIGGTVEVGPGGTSASLDAAPESYGGWSVRMEPWALPPVTIPATGPSGGDLLNPAAAPVPGRYENVRITKGVLRLQAGIYVFDSLTMSGQSLLQVEGPTTIYITGTGGGSLDLSGGSVTNDGPPRNLTLKIGPGVTAEVVVTGSASAAFGLYAPTADIRVAGGSDIFGSLVGRSVTSVGSTAIHYDRSLGSAAQPGSVLVTAWQRF